MIVSTSARKEQQPLKIRPPRIYNSDRQRVRWTDDDKDEATDDDEGAMCAKNAAKKYSSNMGTNC